MYIYIYIFFAGMSFVRTQVRTFFTTCMGMYCEQTAGCYDSCAGATADKLKIFSGVPCSLIFRQISVSVDARIFTALSACMVSGRHK